MRINNYISAFGRLRALICLTAFCLLTAAFYSPVLAAATTVNEVARELICPCPDCGKQALDQCPTCNTGQKHRDEIAAMLKQGKSKQEIINFFGDHYGEHMLGNPRPQGLGIIAPIVPWAGAFLGLGVVLLLLRSSRSASRQRATQTEASSKPASGPATASADDPRLSAALRDFDY